LDRPASLGRLDPGLVTALAATAGSLGLRGVVGGVDLFAVPSAPLFTCPTFNAGSLGFLVTAPVFKAGSLGFFVTAPVFNAGSLGFFVI
jgi:hypothetical protein